MVEFDCFTFIDNTSRDDIGDGVLFLKMILDDIKPSTVINVQDLEDKLANVSLQKHDNNTQTCTRETEKVFKKIKRFKPGTYDKNCFPTQFFQATETTTNESFEWTVEVIKDEWIMGDPTCTIQYVILTLNTKFRNLNRAGIWNKTSEKETKIIALMTALNDQKKKFKELETEVNAKST